MAECWHAVHQLGLECGKSIDELAQEAFRDLLKKHHKPATLKEALKQSTRLLPAKRSNPDALPKSAVTNELTHQVRMGTERGDGANGRPPADRRTKAQTVAKPGQGDKGDRRRPSR